MQVTGQAVAKIIGVSHRIEGSLLTTDNRDGDLVLAPLGVDNFRNSTFVDFSIGSTHAQKYLKLPNIATPFYLRPTRLGKEQYLVTEEIEAGKLGAGGAMERLREANMHSDDLLAYVPFAANHFGVIGLGANPLIQAMAARMRARQGKGPKALAPLREARIRGFFSTAVQKATVGSMIARIDNVQTRRDKKAADKMRAALAAAPILSC